MPTLQGPQEDFNPSLLRGIANSIEPAFPSAAIELRSIADELETKVHTKTIDSALEDLSTYVNIGNKRRDESRPDELLWFDDHPLQPILRSSFNHDAVFSAVRQWLHELKKV